MAETTNAETVKNEASAKVDEEKLAHALVSRGLLSREEYQQFRAVDPGSTNLKTEALLQRLVKAGFLTPHQAERIEPEVPSLINQQVPGYQFLEKLGQGSMGQVFKARQLSMNRLVAVKILHPKLANEEFIERFLREAHLAAKFSSPYVVQAIDVGSAGPLHYFVMEYVEGVTIKHELEKGKIYKEQEAVDIVLQIAQALQHAHRRQLLHRDVKPANIILTADGIAKLADLGMARTTTDHVTAKAEKGLTIGTPYYIAPEQVKSREDVDSRADIYSLGATLYHMVTGRPPFNYPKIPDVLRAHLDEELTPPSKYNRKLSPGLGEVVELMMAKKRAKRYPSPEELIVDLECLLQGEPPRIARSRMATSSLAALADGEDEDAEARQAEEEEKAQLWLYVYGLAAALFLSVVINILQIIL